MGAQQICEWPFMEKKRLAWYQLQGRGRRWQPIVMRRWGGIAENNREVIVLLIAGWASRSCLINHTSKRTQAETDFFIFRKAFSVLFSLDVHCSPKWQDYFVLYISFRLKYIF